MQMSDTLCCGGYGTINGGNYSKQDYVSKMRFFRREKWFPWIPANVIYSGICCPTASNYVRLEENLPNSP